MSEDEREVKYRIRLVSQERGKTVKKKSKQKE